MFQKILKFFEKKNFSATLLYGAIIGFTFSLMYWGKDTLLLGNSNMAYAWLQFVIATICVMFIFSLAAFLTNLINKALAGIVIWVVAARFIAELTVAIPIMITPYFMKIIEPGLIIWVPVHTYTATTKVWITVGFMGLAIFSGVLGFLQLLLVEQAEQYVSPASRIMPFIMTIVIMLVGSVLVINLVNERIQPPMVAVNKLINFSIENKDIKVDPDLAREMHLGALNEVRDMVVTPFRLFLGDYDETFSQVDVIIDFNGNWVTCKTVSGNLTYCKLAERQIHNLLHYENIYQLDPIVPVSFR